MFQISTNQVQMFHFLEHVSYLEMYVWNSLRRYVLCVTLSRGHGMA